MDQNYESIFPERHVIYASFWERFGAAFIDGLIVGIPIVIIARTIGLVHLPAVLFGIIPRWLYSALQEAGFNQATIGGKALGIKATTVGGDRLTFGQATGRHFGKYISTIILFIGYFMMLWDDKSQMLHDKMAGALVVKAR